jgi:hypothetical protein
MTCRRRDWLLVVIESSQLESPDYGQARPFASGQLGAFPNVGRGSRPCENGDLIGWSAEDAT